MDLPFLKEKNDKFQHPLLEFFLKSDQAIINEGIQMEKNGKHLPIFIRYKNNKHTYFRLHADGLHVHASKRMSQAFIHTHIHNNFEIFYEKYLKYKKNEHITLWGEKRINYILGRSSEEDTIALNVLKDALNEKLQVWSEKITQHLKQFQITPRPYALKYYKSKFGSYHRNREYISLNIFLATQNEQYLWYVLMHEYAHTIHFHHQPSFYELLEQLHPNYKIIEKQLKLLLIPDLFKV